MGQEHRTCSTKAEQKNNGDKANGTIALLNEQIIEEQLTMVHRYSPEIRQQI
jgi:hypothetical protein